MLYLGYCCKCCWSSTFQCENDGIIACARCQTKFASRVEFQSRCGQFAAVINWYQKGESVRIHVLPSMIGVVPLSLITQVACQAVALKFGLDLYRDEQELRLFNRASRFLARASVLNALPNLNLVNNSTSSVDLRFELFSYFWGFCQDLFFSEMEDGFHRFIPGEILIPPKCYRISWDQQARAILWQALLIREEKTFAEEVFRLALPAVFPEIGRPGVEIEIPC